MFKHLALATLLGAATLAGGATAAPATPIAPAEIQLHEVGFKKFGHHRGFRKGFRRGFRGGFHRGFRGGFARKKFFGHPKGFKGHGFKGHGGKKFFFPGVVIVK
ncbi:MAG: hypothetical protein AAF568_00450 [Pseudomonadota bacterium]